MAETNITEIPPKTGVLETQGKIGNQVNIETYFARLPEIDKQNLQNIMIAFETVMRERGKRGVLKAVGGTIDKPLPRKDIDLTLRLAEGDSDPKRDDFPDYLQYSLANYNIILDIVREIVARNGNLEIGEEIEPAIDEEYQSPSILKNAGSIKINPREGTPIEIIRKPNISSTIEIDAFVLLSEV